MPLLSDKIIQLMQYESQLERLKKEIVVEHEGILKEAKGNSNNNPSIILKHKIEEYESVSEKYNELFSDILQDSTKMKEEYAAPKKDNR